LPHSFSSDHGLDTLGKDFVAGEGIRLNVVSSNTVGEEERLEVFVVATISVLEHVAHISVGKVGVETSLVIGDFLLSGHIVVVESGLINKALVEKSLEEEVEIGHEASVVTVLVLGKNGKEAVVALSTDVVGLGDHTEVGGGLNHCEGSQTPQHGGNTSLNPSKSIQGP
jgi:hypothetical protein